MNSPDQKALKLTGSQDLLSHFNLLPIYDRFVRPYPPPDRAAGLESSLFPYLSNLPGVVDIEPDNYLMNLLHDPQAHESGPPIRPLDQDTLRDAFSLKLGPVPGFDSSMLGMDDGGAQAPANPDKHISLTLTTSETPSEYNGERKHKKKKKKRKHSHENEEEGHSHSEHKKKKKKKKEREHDRRRDESDSLIID